MYRARNPQESLFGTSNLVPPDKAKRLQASWAEGFRAHALPLIDEEVFAPLYCADTGRPNRPVQTVFGVLLLKEMHGLTDAEALEQLEFNLQWHHALGLTPDEAHLPQKTLHNFRARVMAHDGGRVAFETMTDRILQALGTKVSRQRLDSTHVISHMAVLTRLGLFCETVRLFLRSLKTEHPRLSGRVPEPLRGRYVKADGGATAYDDARAPEGPRRWRCALGTCIACGTCSPAPPPRPCRRMACCSACCRSSARWARNGRSRGAATTTPGNAACP